MGVARGDRVPSASRYRASVAVESGANSQRGPEQLLAGRARHPAVRSLPVCLLYNASKHLDSTSRIFAARASPCHASPCAAPWRSACSGGRLGDAPAAKIMAVCEKLSVAVSEDEIGSSIIICYLYLCNKRCALRLRDFASGLARKHAQPVCVVSATPTAVRWRERDGTLAAGCSLLSHAGCSYVAVNGKRLSCGSRCAGWRRCLPTKTANSRHTCLKNSVKHAAAAHFSSVVSNAWRRMSSACLPFCARGRQGAVVRPFPRRGRCYRFHCCFALRCCLYSLPRISVRRRTLATTRAARSSSALRLERPNAICAQP